MCSTASRREGFHVKSAALARHGTIVSTWISGDMELFLLLNRHGLDGLDEDKSGIYWAWRYA